MNKLFIPIVLMFLMISTLTSCNSLKKETKKEVTSTTITPAKSKDGIYEPGSVELTAIQKEFPAATQVNLVNGFKMYIGVCINCHEAKNIYRIPKYEWKGIMEDMAHKAKISKEEKEDILLFVYSIKATQ